MSKRTAGDRMPYFLVDGKNVYDKLREPKFHLLVFSHQEDSYESMMPEAEHEYCDFIDFHVIPLNPHVVEIFGTNRPFKVLLRPDNYIGFISTDFCWDDLKAYINVFISHRQ